MPAHKKPEHEKSKSITFSIKIPLLLWLKSISKPDTGEFSHHINAAIEMYQASKQL